MDDWELTVYLLAEKLSMPVYKLKQEMPLAELMGWIQFIREKGKERPIEIAELPPEKLKEMFG